MYSKFISEKVRFPATTLLCKSILFPNFSLRKLDVSYPLLLVVSSDIVSPREMGLSGNGIIELYTAAYFRKVDRVHSVPLDP